MVEMCLWSTTIVDVMVAYESGPDSFSKARFEKAQKYAGLNALLHLLFLSLLCF